MKLTLVNVKPNSGIEINYKDNQTKVRLQRFKCFNEDLFDKNTHYFQIGAQYEVRKSPKQKAFPYTLATLGATLLDFNNCLVKVC